MQSVCVNIIFANKQETSRALRERFAILESVITLTYSKYFPSSSFMHLLMRFAHHPERRRLGLLRHLLLRTSAHGPS